MTTLHDLLQAAPASRTAVVHGDLRLSSGELAERATAVAGAINARGIGHGDRVAFQLPVGWPTIVLYRACWRTGVVPVALHPMAGTAQLTNAIDQSEPSLLVTALGMALHEHPHAIGLDELTGGSAPNVAVTPDDDALVMFTSGTSGSPKGVVHRHLSLVYKTRQLLDVHGLGPTDTVLMPAPLAHVSGLLHGVLVPGAAGATAVLMESWDPGRALDLIESEAVTWMIGPPTFFLGLLDHTAFSQERVDSLRLISCGGAGVSPAFVERARDELGAVVKRAYGSTEAPTITTSRHDDPPERMTTTDGRTFGEGALRLSDDGELWVRGPELAAGYLDADRTVEAFVDGWFRTGDLATIDGGWLTIVGRRDDRIIRGGENISAAEVAQYLEAHPAVDQAVAVPEADERLGERVAAFVIAPNGFTLDTCVEWFKEQGVARFITPERIIVLDEFPLLPSGKVDRLALVSLL